MQLFNPQRHQLHLARSARVFHDHCFLYNDIAAELIDRLADIKRNFHRILNLSPHPLSFPMKDTHITEAPPPYLQDMNLPQETFGLIISNLCLHWSEDPVGQLIQIRQALKPDGLFLASFFGGESLHELRTSLMEAEMELTGGASLRTAPMMKIQDAPTVLGRGGFAMPVVDTETYTVTYPSLRQMVNELRGMGETLKTQDTSPAHPQLFQRAEHIYREKFGLPDATLPVTVDVITLAGWAPCATQAQPLAPGSASHSLEEALEG